MFCTKMCNEYKNSKYRQNAKKLENNFLNCLLKIIVNFFLVFVCVKETTICGGAG